MMKTFLLILFVLAPAAFAAIDPNANQANSLMATFQSASTSWRAAIVPAAKYVFYTLVIMDWVIEFGFMAIKGTDIGEIFAVLIRKTLVIGFFLMLFTHGDWLATIPNSLAQIGNNAAGMSVSPDNILLYALQIVDAIWDGISLTEIADSLILVFAGIVLLIAFGLMAAQLFMTYVKMYALLAVAPLIFSLAGLQNTRQMAYNPFFAIIKVGLELMFLKLFLGLTITKVQAFAASVETDNSSIMTMIAVSVLMVGVVHMIPGMVESVATGSLGANSTAGLGMAQAAAAGVGGAVGGAVGAGAAVKAASNLAKEQRAGGDTTASTFKNLRSAFANDVQRSMAGENIGGGSMGARMAFKHSSDASLMAQTKAMQGISGGTDVKAQTANEEAGFAAQSGNGSGDVNSNAKNDPVKVGSTTTTSTVDGVTTSETTNKYL